MQYRQLPQLPDQPLSVLGFGSASISGEGGGYGFGPISEEDSITLVRKAWERGINVFDTAPIYGFGEAERRLGRALKPFREKIFLLSKSGVTWDRHRRVDIDNSVSTTQRMLEQSLRDLNTDWIDLYLVHWPDPRHDIRSTIEYLAKAREQGKINHIGLSNTNSGDLQRALEIAPILAVQGESNLFVRRQQTSFLSDLEQLQIGFFAWGTFDKGILTGRVTPARTFQKPDARAHAPWWKNADRTRKFAAMQDLAALASTHGFTLTEMALSAVLSQAQLTSALVGIRDLAQLESAVEALQRPLSAELLGDVQAIVDRHLSPQ